MAKPVRSARALSEVVASEQVTPSSVNSMTTPNAGRSGVGSNVGMDEGRGDGIAVGDDVGLYVGNGVGARVGSADGFGVLVGDDVGNGAGIVGINVGGTGSDGVIVGFELDCAVVSPPPSSQAVA